MNQSAIAISLFDEYQTLSAEYQTLAHEAVLNEVGARHAVPFVPILRGGGEESTVRRALQVLRTNEQLNELESLLAFFATFV